MNHSPQAARLATLARLQRSRAEIIQILDPPPPETSDDADGSSGVRDHSFPRSRTMKMLFSGRGVGTVGAMVGGLVLARPALAFKLLRLLPSGAVARMLMVKAFSALRSRN